MQICRRRGEGGLEECFRYSDGEAIEVWSCRGVDVEVQMHGALELWSRATGIATCRYEAIGV